MENFTRQNAPLKSGKGSLYEGGIRVPFIVKWNNIVKPNTRSHAPIIIEDLYPTLLSMAGIKNYHVPQKNRRTRHYTYSSW